MNQLFERKLVFPECWVGCRVLAKQFIDDEVDKYALGKGTQHGQQQLCPKFVGDGKVPKSTDTPVVISVLMKLLLDSSGEVRASSSRALSKLGQKLGNKRHAVVVKLLAMRTDPDFGVRHAAAKTLGDLGSYLAEQTKDVIQVLLDLCRADDDSLRDFAACALRGLGPHLGQLRPTVVHLLVEMLHDEEASRRCFAAKALSGLGEVLGDQMQNVLQKLTQLCSHPDYITRTVAINVLASIAPRVQNTQPSLQILVRCMKEDSSSIVRRASTQALCRIWRDLSNHTSSELLDHLVNMLNSDLADDRGFAIKELSDLVPGLGDKSQEVVSLLITQLYQDMNCIERSRAVQALRNLWSCLEEEREEVIETLTCEICKDSNFVVRHSAVQALGQLAPDLGPQMQDAVDTLINHMCKDADLLVRCSTAQALGLIGLSAKDRCQEEAIVNALLKMLGDPSESVRSAAIESLGSLGPDLGSQRMEVIGALMEMREDRHSMVRFCASVAVRTILPYLSRQVSEEDLSRMMKVSSEEQRHEVILELLLMCQDPSEQIRSSAAEALGCLLADASEADVSSCSSDGGLKDTRNLMNRLPTLLKIWPVRGTLAESEDQVSAQKHCEAAAFKHAK